jgi:putative NADH-flavin reductase
VRRLVIVGTAGTLLGEDGTQRMDGANFPAFLRDEATSHRELQEYLRRLDLSAIEWTYFSPPVTIEPGDRTGSYMLGADQLMVNGAGESYISNEDYAVALLDELERPQHVGRRFTAVSERG